MPKLPPPFGVLRNGEPILLAPLGRTVSTGIAFSDPRMDLGLVPEYEEREAAALEGIPWQEWLTMPMQERAAGVAHYRLHHLIAMHSQDAVQAAQERKQRMMEARNGS